MRTAVIAATVFGASVAAQAWQGDAVTRARALGAAGQRTEAISLLLTALAATPSNSDARVLLGTILSWERRFDEARMELGLVLSGNPTHGDALPAAINVELWSDHPQRAEELTRRGLQRTPAHPQYLLARARALVALQRSADAADTLDRLLSVDPRNAQGLALRRTLSEAARLWHARVGVSHDAAGGRTAWRESHVSLSRATPIGPVAIRGARADRFGLHDTQIEIETYPRLRPGTYAYVAGAYSPDARLYPRYRYAADLYQSLGSGFEGSAGVRRLSFGSGVTVYVGSLSKYYGPWLVTARVFATPNDLGTSTSSHASVRRYFGEAGSYVGARYGRGAWREELRDLSDLDVLDSDVVAADAIVVLRRRLELTFAGLWSREDRVGRPDLRGYSATTGLGVRF
jgi:YaiO family outer membrane protein